MPRPTGRRILLSISALALVAGVAIASVPRRSSTLLPIVEGTRVKTLHDEKVYLVLDGELRHMRAAAHRNTFGHWNGMGRISEPPEEMIGDVLTGETRLIRVKDERAVWLIVNGKERRHIREWLDFNPRLVEPVTWSELLKYVEGEPIGGRD